MCEQCAGATRLLENHDARIKAENGLHLSKEEIMCVVQYMHQWNQRQCMCCYSKDGKNLDRMNNIVQVVLRTAIEVIKNLPDLLVRERRKETSKAEEQAEGVASSSITDKGDKITGKNDNPSAEKEEKSEGADSKAKESAEGKDKKDETMEDSEKEVEEEDLFSAEEKVRLLDFTCKVFMVNFPMYCAQKILTPTTLEELNPHETAALSNYCELNDPEAPIALLRNVCFMCDSQGFQALQTCFQKATPDNLPFNFAQWLVNLIANLRMWMNQPTVLQHIIPLRSSIIEYICSLSDSDLRLAGNRHMTDLMWAAVKLPPDASYTFDSLGLKMAYKWFTCSTLTSRLTGIAQINNQISIYNESMGNDSLEEAQSFGGELARWLLDKKIVEHIFGPNLHVELVKQSQMILNFLAIDNRLTNDHIDCIWAASQLKHCSKQVYDILIPLIKNLDDQANKHLSHLVSELEPSVHNENTLYISSALDKFKWQSRMNAHHHHHLHPAAIQQQLQPHVGPYAAHRGDAVDVKGLGKGVKHDHDLSSSESDGEQGRKRPMRPKMIKKRRVGGPAKGVEGEVEMESTGDEQCCAHHHHHMEHHPHHQHHHRLHEDSLGSDSSLGAQSDLSEDSTQEDHLVEAAKAAEKHKFAKHLSPQHRHHRMHPGSAPIDSEECTESSEEEEEDEDEEDEEDEEEAALLEEETLQMRKKKEQAAALRRDGAKMAGLKKSPEGQERKKSDRREEEEISESDKKLNESSEMEVYGQDHSEVELLDSDEELMKQAKLVRMKHVYPHDSEDSSDYPDLEEDVIMMKHRLHQQQQLQKQGASPTLIQQAANIVMRHKLQSAELPLAGGPRSRPMRAGQESQGESQDESEINVSGERLTGEAGLGKLPLSQLTTSVQEGGSGCMGCSSSHHHHHQGGEVLPDCSKETEEIYDCSNAIQQMQNNRRRIIHSDYVEDILSPDDGSCHSSRISTKSEKNMADFEGEEALSEEELAQIHAQAQYGGSPHHVAQHLTSMALYHHPNLPKSVIHHRGMPRERHQMSVAPPSDFTFDDVCKKGNTLIWDLVQDDMAAKLPEGLLIEAEKALHSLVCYSVDRCIKTKFIEACIQNLANHKSVYVSLRLLPKIFSSFQSFRNSEHHNITMWAETELHMMRHFFNDLVHFTETRSAATMPPNALYSFRDEIQVRLMFLTMVFSILGSPDRFRLNQEQVDTLWRCLAQNPACSDDCLSWFLNQAKSKDHHALGVETFRHIFLEKIPQLNPESMTMIGLNLFQHLSHLTRMSSTSHHPPLTEDQICGMDQMWQIALQAENKDVSMTATQVINNYYINYGGGILDREDMFIRRCMHNLINTLTKIKENPTVYLQREQRVLILLKNHLELFNRRYAFHLRTWQLDGVGVMPHQAQASGKVSSPLRIMLQTSGITEKTQLDMLSSDLVSELRAEVTRWWEMLQKQQQQQQEQQQQQQQSMSELPHSHHGHQLLSPILGAMLGDGPIRIITLGQELTVDFDEKSLGEVGIKDMQLVFVSVGASRQPKRHDGSLPSSCLPLPDRAKIPQNLLTQEPHFGNLFTLLENLSNVGSELDHLDSQERASIEADARRLSRSVWELLMMLPTSPLHLEGFTQQDGETSRGDASSSKMMWDRLLPPHSPHRLYYSLQIVEQLAYGKQQRKKALMRTGGGDALAFASEGSSETGADSDTSDWSSKFVTKGGMSHLLSIFMTGTLQPQEAESWSQWNQECLAYLLRIITQFSVERQDVESMLEDEAQESPRKKIRRLRGLEEKVLIPRIMQSTLKVLNEEAVLKILMQILYEAALPVDTNQLYLCSWGRAEVVRCALSLLVSVAYSCSEITGLQSATPDLTAWLKRLTLEAPEPYVRKEACMGLYRLCLGHTADNKLGRGFLVPILSSLLTFLKDAILFKPQQGSEIEGKEPFGPGCRDYFWLVCHLLEGLGKEEATSQQDTGIDLDSLMRHCSSLIASRPYHETRHGYEEDDGLCGLLRLQCAILKHNTRFKESAEGKALVKDAFDYLFALPSTSKRYLPLCKSSASRSASFDLLIEVAKGSPENYSRLQRLLMSQHRKESHLPYPFEYWPQDDGRSKAAYVGIQNLGATCYMAAALQFLFMIPDLRESILQAKVTECVRHEGVLMELQKMFAYLQESERKSYNPKSFCKMYMMDNQPLNTGEQKDMTEFFTDLITKIEEMSPTLKVKIKDLFGGVITNNVVSLDCPHVSRTFEEFYTVRCQVCDMKDLDASLNEVTVKDTLEGDNKYLCSKGCKKPVRAEKRACFRKLSKVLCFNTMRYAFNINSMMKEKVNTYFSFPRRLDMSPYMEHKLLGADKLKECEESDQFGLGERRDDEYACYEYELMGVTVHTGTADGGHYYSFIRCDMEKQDSDAPESWLLCNDAEVKPFDASQLAIECFGGEMTSKTYDSVSDKFLDLSFEKTNSAYMLFYKRVEKEPKSRKYNFELCPELAEWIWQDNMQFLKDKNLFEHSYFNFMWQVCGYLPSTMPKCRDELNPASNVTLLQATQLTASFVLETLIHSKEKPTMLQWIETLTKQFIACPEACEWFINHMAEDDWWPIQILIKCPNHVVRQLFYRLLIHVTSLLRGEHAKLYMQPNVTGEDGEYDVSELGNRSCVTRFIKKLLSIIEHVRPHSKYLTEYFLFLLEFAKLGEEECSFLTNINCISTMVQFYMGQKQQENYVEILSDDEEEDEVLTLTDDNKPTALEKMIALISLLVEKSRGSDKQLHLPHKDYMAIVGGGKGFPFLLNQIRDMLNIRQTTNLIYSLTRWNDSLAVTIVNTLFTAIKKLSPEIVSKSGTPNPVFQHAQPFFKLLTLLVEFNTGTTTPPPGLPNFIQIVLHKMWDLAKVAPVAVMEWLTTQVTRNKLAHMWVLEQMGMWVEHYLIAHNNPRVRNAAAYLLMSLVPCNQFRSLFRSGRSLHQTKDIQISPEALAVVHKIYNHLLGLLKVAKNYVDPQVHGTMKLVCYFTILQFCVLTKREKLMFSHYFDDLWQLFQPKLLEPQIAMHHNKQALLIFWYVVCVDCPENVELITSNAHVCKNIAFNYILADHEDQEIMMFNRCMLPSYYGLLRLACQHSRQFTRQLADHQNIQWAFKNITPYPSQYTVAVEELYKMMRLMSARYPDSTEEELRAVTRFRRNTISMYIRDMEARTHWQTLVSALKILVEGHDERLMLLYHHGLTTLSESFATLHVMYHEATACHVTGDIIDLLTLLQQCLKTARECMDKKVQCANEMKSILMNWKERGDVVKKLLTLLNSYTPPEVRTVCFEVLKQMILTLQPEMITQLVPFLCQWHSTFQENNVHNGPFFPRRGQKPMTSKTSIRPPRPQFQMMLHPGLLEASKGVDDTYDQQVYSFFIPYHMMLDTLQRLAININSFSQSLINLGAMVAYEGVPIHSPLFAKLWNEVYFSDNPDLDHSLVQMLCKSQYFLNYCDAVLMDERMSLNNFHIFNFFTNFFPKVHEQVLQGQTSTFIDSLVAAMVSERAALENMHSEKDINSIFHRICGDVRALLLIFSVHRQPTVNPMLLQSLRQILVFCRLDQQRRASAAAKAARSSTEEVIVDDSEVRTDADRDGSSSETHSAKMSKDSGAKPSGSSESHPDSVSSAADSAKYQHREEEPSTSHAGEGGKESEEDVMCVDVTEASESIEVCTTPSVEESAQPQPGGSGSSPGAVKRHISAGEDGEKDQPASKKPRGSTSDDSADKTTSSPKEQAQKPDDSGTAEASKGGGQITPEKQKEEPSCSQRRSPSLSQAGTSAGQSSGRSSPDSSGQSTSQGPSSSKEDNVKAGEASTSSGQQRLERGSSRESEDGGNGSGGSPLNTSGSSPKHIVDKVAVNIEQLLRLLEKSSSS
ncbi:hypothetical protein V1264_018890 [Littorina saxatilis]|uniref:USP domain-containing protein n=1 Tax=Littorina saxatilis TaxID=31220 RepID=A0AAN9BG43_9CAEN